MLKPVTMGKDNQLQFDLNTSQETRWYSSGYKYMSIFVASTNLSEMCGTETLNKWSFPLRQDQ